LTRNQIVFVVLSLVATLAISVTKCHYTVCVTNYGIFRRRNEWIWCWWWRQRQRQL